MSIKQVYVNIQIDNVTTRDVADIEELIEKALKAYPQNRVTISISDLPRTEVPPRMELE